MSTSRTFRHYVSLYKHLDLEDLLVYSCVQLLLCKKTPLLIKDWSEESRIEKNQEKIWRIQHC